VNDANLKPIVLIRGAGEMASGIAYRVHLNGYRVCLTEIPFPLAVSRANTFSDAVFDGEKSVCGVTAERVATIEEIESVWGKGRIPLVIDAETNIKKSLRQDVLVDATMAKKHTGTCIDDAPFVIGVGPGFYAGRDVHVVVETENSHGNLGNLIRQGEAEINTGIPVETGGATFDRVLWSPVAGVFKSDMRIGDPVKAGQIIGTVDSVPLVAKIGGKLRGIIRDGTAAPEGAKLIEIDSVNREEVFYLIRGKIWNVGEAVVEAIKQQLMHPVT
jgi:xanthine dehydrogenase accessory factor